MALWLLGILARPWTWWRILLVAAMAGGAVLALVIPFVRDFFALEVPAPFTALMIAVVGGLGCVVIEIVHRTRRTRLPD